MHVVNVGDERDINHSIIEGAKTKTIFKINRPSDDTNYHRLVRSRRRRPS